MAKKILFCWSDISGYMVACWKALDRLDDIEVQIIAFSQSKQTSFENKMTEGLKITFVDREPEYKTIESTTEKFDPDVIVLCGWFVPAYKKLADKKSLLRHSTFILAMDTPWWGRPKQQVAPYFLRSFVKKMQAVITSGERSYQYAQRLGAKKIFKIQYGVDALMLKEAYLERKKTAWPKRFLFVGRYAQEKGIDILMKAYTSYRQASQDPWPLDTCGKGELENLLNEEGVNNHGFVQPIEMKKIWRDAGCLILSSTFDPWPLIVVEACAAGLPVIATHASGSQVEVVKMYYNGLVVNEGDSADLKKAMLWIQDHYHNLPKMGSRSLAQAEPYEAIIWAEKFMNMCESLS